jgi:hypothetical protein
MRIPTGRQWNVRPGETELSLPCDGYLSGDVLPLLRGIDIAAPADLVYRWICQITIAPYSYDLIDNFGRRSPRQLTPGADELRKGQRFMVFRIVDFEPGVHLSVVALPAGRRLFGGLAMTYLVSPVDPENSRLLVRLCCAADGPVEQLRRFLLTYGDLVMMRKQLRTLKKLAERDAALQLA